MMVVSFFLHHKSDVVQTFIEFSNYISNQFHSEINIVRTDNAMELCEGKLKAFYLSKGILHQKRCVYTPQQNGVV